MRDSKVHPTGGSPRRKGRRGKGEANGKKVERRLEITVGPDHPDYDHQKNAVQEQSISALTKQVNVLRTFNKQQVHARARCVFVGPALTAASLHS